MCVRKRVLTEKCGPFDSSIHSADNMQSKNLTFFKHNSNCSQRGMNMSQPQTRMTRQRMVILEELRKVKTHPTADELYAMVRTRMPRISLGTVYRNLEKMVEQGMVAKYNVDGTSSACFEYLGAEEHCHKTSCFHCKCEKCGKLIHLHCEDVVKLEQHLMDRHGFRMDPCRTVFYGICEECRSVEDEASETVHMKAR